MRETNFLQTRRFPGFSLTPGVINHQKIVVRTQLGELRRASPWRHPWN